MKDFTAQVRLIFVDSFSDTAKEVSKSMADIQTGMGKMNSAGSGSLQNAAQLSLVASQASRYSQAISNAIEVPSNVSAGLEQALAAASTVVTDKLAIDGSLEKTIDTLKSRALDWSAGITEGSKKANISAQEYAQTSYNMLSAGLKADAAFNATEQAALLAKATMGDASSVAALLATAYNTMGDKSADSRTELTKLSDVLAKTQAAFQIQNIAQLNDGLKYGIPAAQKYGIAFDELSTIIGQLNTSGLTGSLAGTAFQSMADKLVTGQSKLGFKVDYNDDGSMNVIGTLENIREKFGDISTWNERLKIAFGSVFGETGSKGLTLLMTSLDDLKASFADVADSEGQTALMANRMSDTYTDRVNVMNNARAGMLSRIGDAANRTKGAFSGVKTAFYNMASTILDTKFGGVFGGLIANAGLATGKLLSLGSGALNVVTQLVTIGALSSKTGGLLQVLKGGLGMCIAPVKGLALGFGKLTLSLLPYIAIVAAVAGAAYLIIKHWEGIKTFFVNLWDSITGIFSNAWEKIKKPFEKIGSWFGFGKNKDNPLDTMAEGVKNSSALSDAVQSSVADAALYIPHSDAPKGPFSTLTESEMSISGTMAKGVKLNSSALSNAENETFSIPFKSERASSTGSNNIFSVLQAINSKFTELLGRKTDNGSIVIQNVNLPDVDDVDGMIRFVKDLRCQLEGVSA